MSVLTGCGNKQENVSIDLLLAVPIQDNRLNHECKELLLPFEGMEGSVFLPQGNIMNATDSLSYIKPQTWVDNLRGNMTKNTTSAILKQKISNHLANLDLGPIASKTAFPYNYIDSIVKKYDTTIGFNPKIKSDKNYTGYPFKCFSSAGAIRAYIIDSLLSRDINGKILIVYGMPLTEEIKIITPVANTVTAQPSSPVKEKMPPRQQAPINKETWQDNYTLGEYFEKIADANIPAAQKGRLKTGILKYFTSDEAEVILELDGLYAGNTFTIKNYAEHLSTTFHTVTINKTEQNGGKISKIYVTEH